MLSTCSTTKYCIAYIGVSYLGDVINDSLGYAYLENQAGNFVNVSQSDIQSSVNSLASKTPANEIISLINPPGANSYPIVNFEYALVSKNQNTTGMALALRTLLSWAISPTGGNSPYFMDKVNFVALPSSVAALSQAQINEITGP